MMVGATSALLANEINVAQNVGFYIIAAMMLFGAFDQLRSAGVDVLKRDDLGQALNGVDGMGVEFGQRFA